MKHRHPYRKPDTLLLLAAAVALGVVMSSVQADDRLSYTPVEPGSRLVSLFMDDGYIPDSANPGSRLQLSFDSPSLSPREMVHVGHSSLKPTRFLLSWRLLW